MSEHTETAVTGRTAGEMLREARVTAGLAQDDVARELRQDVKTVEALENDDHAAFSAPIFISGYLRAYARAVGLAPEAVLDAYRRQAGEAPPTLKPNSRAPKIGSGTRLGKSLGFVVAVLLLVVLGFSWWQSRNDADAVTLPAAGSEQQLEFPDPEPLAPPAAPPEVPAPAPLPLPVPSLPEGPLPPPSSPVTSPQTSVPAHGTVSTEPSGPLENRPGLAEVVLSFKADSSVEISDAGGRKLMLLMGKAGTTRSVRGTPPLTVSLGYAPGVRVAYNGAPFDFSPYMRNEVARFTLGEAR